MNVTDIEHPAEQPGGTVQEQSLIDDGQRNGGNGYEPFEEQDKAPESDHRATLRAILRDVQQITLDDLKTKITAMLPGATFEVDNLGQIVIRASYRPDIDSEAMADTLRAKARLYVPPKRGRVRRRK